MNRQTKKEQGKRNAGVKGSKGNNVSSKKSNRLLIILAVVLGLLLVFVIAFIIIKQARYPEFCYESDRQVYVMKSSGIEYNYASASYEPVTYLDKYAKFGSNWMYNLLDTDPEKWLYSDIGLMFYAKGEKLPTLSEMDPDKMFICTEDVCIGTVSRGETLDRLIKYISEGEAVVRPESDEMLYSYTCRFASKEYSWLYYSVTFIHTDRGNYLVDRGQKKTVSIGDIDLGEMVLYYDGSAETE